jgi:hypothetical protein
VGIISLSCILTLILSYYEKRFEYNQAWVTGINYPNNLNITEEGGQNANYQPVENRFTASQEVLKTLKGLNHPLETSWRANRKYKSATVYIEATSPEKIEEIYKQIKELVNIPIIKTNTLKSKGKHEKFLRTTTVTLVLWVLLCTLIVIPYRYKFLVYSTMCLTFILIVDNYIRNTKPWQNITKLNIKTPSPVSPKDIAYQELLELHYKKTTIGELMVRILEEKGDYTTFRFVPLDASLRQKRKKDLNTLWIKSTAKRPDIESALEDAQAVFKEYNRELKLKESLSKPN